MCGGTTADIWTIKAELEIGWNGGKLKVGGVIYEHGRYRDIGNRETMAEALDQLGKAALIEMLLQFVENGEELS